MQHKTEVGLSASTEDVTPQLTERHTSKLRSAARFIIEQSKKQAWIEFLQTSNNRTPQQKIRSTISKIRGTDRKHQGIALTSKSNGTTTSHALETAGSLVDNFPHNPGDTSTSRILIN